jgi:hypothetical protein
VPGERSMKSLVILLYLASFLACRSMDRPIYQPDSLIVQSGSYAGAIATGVSYNIANYYRPEFLIGYTPLFITKYDILSFTMKNTLYTSIKDYTLYAGYQFLYLPFDSDVFVIQPSRYPDDYYPPTAIRTAPYLGLEYDNFYLEFAGLDLYLETYMRSNFNMKLHEVGTYGIGYRFAY